MAVGVEWKRTAESVLWQGQYKRKQEKNSKLIVHVKYIKHHFYSEKKKKNPLYLFIYNISITIIQSTNGIKSRCMKVKRDWCA